MNYDSAKSACTAIGQSLPVINSEEENINAMNACGSSSCCWLGLEQQPDKSWKWTDGTTLTYSIWDGSEGTIGGSQNRAFICPGRGFKGWHDVDAAGEGETQVLCESGGKVVTTSTSSLYQSQARGNPLISRNLQRLSVHAAQVLTVVATRKTVDGYSIKENELKSDLFVRVHQLFTSPVPAICTHRKRQLVSSAYDAMTWCLQSEDCTGVAMYNTTAQAPPSDTSYFLCMESMCPILVAHNDSVKGWLTPPPQVYVRIKNKKSECIDLAASSGHLFDSGFILVIPLLLSWLCICCCWVVGSTNICCFAEVAQSAARDAQGAWKDFAARRREQNSAAVVQRAAAREAKQEQKRIDQEAALERKQQRNHAILEQKRAKDAAAEEKKIAKIAKFRGGLGLAGTGRCSALAEASWGYPK